ncbi:MAG: hypothetical protein GWO04_37710, partial [Actinobacteria bacterium]|nr:hypothetical protein [Actinomycetota bacterium]
MWRVLGLAAICSWLVGCSLESGALLPSGPADSSPPADSAVDARIDATTDAPSDAMDAMLDAGDATTDAPMPPCAPSPAEDDVVALFSFEDIEGASSTFDTISGREGRVLRGPAVSVEGVGDCGRAFYMPDDSDTAIVV